MERRESDNVGVGAATTAVQLPRPSGDARRRYEVSGVDEWGDVHVFLTDDRERAEGVQRQLEEDLEHVSLRDLGEG